MFSHQHWLDFRNVGTYPYLLNQENHLRLYIILCSFYFKTTNMNIPRRASHITQIWALYKQYFLNTRNFIYTTLGLVISFVHYPPNAVIIYFISLAWENDHIKIICVCRDENHNYIIIYNTLHVVPCSVNLNIPDNSYKWVQYTN